MKKMIILGANGYIARNLIYVLKRNYPEYELLLYGCEPASVDGEEKYTSVDMTNRDSVKKIDLSCDVVFMFVGKTGSERGFVEYDSFIDINERALLNLLDEYRMQRSRARIIYPSTRLVYKGKHEPIDEESEKEFKTIYAMNKYSCEQYLKQFHRVYGVQYSIFRICVPYGTMISGAYSRGTAEFMFERATNGNDIVLYGGGSVRRTITYIEDLCITLVEGAISEKCANDVFNIGGEDYSLMEMARMITYKYGIGIECVPWPDLAFKIESGDTVFDSSKLDKIIGNKIRHKFSEWVKLC